MLARLWFTNYTPNFTRQERNTFKRARHSRLLTLWWMVSLLRPKFRGRTPLEVLYRVSPMVSTYTNCIGARFFYDKVHQAYLDITDSSRNYLVLGGDFTVCREFNYPDFDARTSHLETAFFLLLTFLPSTEEKDYRYV